jgi:hypothetical protein
MVSRIFTTRRKYFAVTIFLGWVSATWTGITLFLVFPPWNFVAQPNCNESGAKKSGFEFPPPWKALELSR